VRWVATHHKYKGIKITYSKERVKVGANLMNEKGLLHEDKKLQEIVKNL
jgi:hypothetical protein